jgi:hypothetical protein
MPCGGSGIGSRIRVLCVVPAGRGGIASLFRYLDENGSRVGSQDVDIRYFISRTNHGKAGWTATFPLRIVAFVFQMLFGGVDVVHLNVSNRASAARKVILF